MCFNKKTYYDCPEMHLQSSVGQLCMAPYQCGSWRRHDPDRLKRLHILESPSPKLCPKCPPPFGSGSSKNEEITGDENPRVMEPPEAMVQELRLAKRAMLVPRRVASIRKGDGLVISIRMKPV
ncbi:hypothetical protein PG996_014116 [Apiospora saccharicola]|uniref:Uncharacterized protein n=1 Tax=Apiospora saccharicola TaxID=335842 RepID=A0ABR1THH0_9PEZI